MSKYLTIRLPGSKDRITVTAPMLVSFFLNEAHGDPTQAIGLARTHVVGKPAQRVVIAAIATALLCAPAARANPEGANG